MLLCVLCNLLAVGAFGLDGAPAPAPWAPSSSVTPVTRVVNLLKDMSVTLKKDKDEDANLHNKLRSWCSDNSKTKGEAIKAGTDQIAELGSTISRLTASSKALGLKVKELKAEVADNKDTLATATALRNKELADFRAGEKDSTGNIANLKTAIHVMRKHHGSALPQMDAVSFLQMPFESKSERDLDMFMADGFADSSETVSQVSPETSTESQLLQHTTEVVEAPRLGGWSPDDVAAVHTASLLAQKHVPGYKAQSGEIHGVLRQLKEDIQTALRDSQNSESERASIFADLRTAKTAEIASGEKSIDAKEEELAKANLDNQDAKEDIEQATTTLAEDQKFVANLGETCDKANANFATRTKSRVAEMKAVADTVRILSGDAARAAAKGTYGNVAPARARAPSAAAPAPAPATAIFLQLQEVSSSQSDSGSRSRLAEFLRSRGMASLASSAELDAFKEVKQKINKMMRMLRIQQSDEVKKNDYCKNAFQSNDMTTMRTKDRQGNLRASAGERKVAIKRLRGEIRSAASSMAGEKLSMAKAAANRKKENLEFRKDVADQTLTIQVLERAMDRLATYYDDQAFIQTQMRHTAAAAPAAAPGAAPGGAPAPAGAIVPAQAKYKANRGANVVISMIEKLIYDAREITAESKKNEADSQAAYDALVEDSNDTMKSHRNSIMSKSDTTIEAKRDLTRNRLDLKATGRELQKLAKLDADMHEDCDFLLKNFKVRQQARGREIESLQQSKNMLNGASE